MAATALLSVLAEHLGTVLPAGVTIGPVQPVAVADVPAVALSLRDVEPTLLAVGRLPTAVRTGALRVETTVDLADPVLRLPGETIVLLSPDRRVLQLPHGGIVRADGSEDPPFGPADLRAARGATVFTTVDDVPAAGECRPDPVTGAVTFGSPLPATGSLALGYFVGIWEVAVERHVGVLRVDAYASSAVDTIDISDQVVDTLDGAAVAGVRRLDLDSAGPVVPAGFGSARRRDLTYRFDFEREVTTIRTSGGPIRSVAADLFLDGDAAAVATETLTVDREGSDA